MHEFGHEARQYALGALKLHHLFAAGQCDSYEADQVRDRLEVLQDTMPADDLEYLKNLSGDLYMIIEEDMYRRIDEATRKSHRIRLFDAISNEDWVTVLDLLLDDLHLPRAVVAHYRSRAYGAFPEVSRAFQEIADKELMQHYGRKNG